MRLARPSRPAPASGTSSESATAVAAVPPGFLRPGELTTGGRRMWPHLWPRSPVTMGLICCCSEASHPTTLLSLFLLLSRGTTIPGVLIVHGCFTRPTDKASLIPKPPTTLHRLVALVSCSLAVNTPVGPSAWSAPGVDDPHGSPQTSSMGESFVSCDRQVLATPPLGRGSGTRVRSQHPCHLTTFVFPRFLLQLGRKRAGRGGRRRGS